MKTFLDLKAAGLQTQPNNLGDVPPGSLLVADNIVIDREGVIQQRRGIAQFANPVTAVAATPSGTITFGTPSNGSTVIITNLPDQDGPVTFTKVGSSPTSVQFTTIAQLTALLNGLLYLNATDNGTVTTLTASSVAGSAMNAVTITGTSSYIALSVTFSGGIGGLIGNQQLFEYDERLVAYNGGTFAYQNSAGSTSFTSIAGAYQPPFNSELLGDAVIRSFIPNQNMYLTTSTGIKRFEFSASALNNAGGLPGLDGNASTTGSSGWMTDNTAVAYRMVWVYKDSFDTDIVGAPSERVIVSNTAGGGATRDVSLTFTIPTGVTTDFTYKIYRSSMSATSATEPDDELKLVIQDSPSSGEISAKLFTLTDSTPDSLRGEDLYTNSGQQGIAQANEVPPIALDFCLFKGYALYANTQVRQRFFLTLTSVDAPDGIQANDTVTINGIVYTGKASETIASNEFKVTTSSTPAENIDLTARSLIRVINRSTTTNGVYATYSSGFGDLPGEILIFERTLGGGTFPIASSRTTCWSPVLPESSSSDRNVNKLYWSKPQQPEAVPIVNNISIGSANSPIERIIALRDRVIVFKPEGGFRLTGESAPFVVNLLDDTIHLIGSNTPAALNNQIFCLTNQFVAAISETSVAIVSRPIEKDLQRLLTADLLAELKINVVLFGAGYETDRKYILALPTEAEDIRATQYYVYNTVTQTWTHWTLPSDMSFALVNSFDDKMYWIGDEMYQERKEFDLTDYADFEYSRTIVSFDDTEVELNSTTDIVEGSFIEQSDSVFALVTEVVDSTHVIVDRIQDWALTTVTVETPITIATKYAPIHGGSPGIQKIFQEFTCFFDEAQFSTLRFTFSTDNYGAGDDVSVMPVDQGGFGIRPFGIDPWGDVIKTLQPIRDFFTRNTSRARWMLIEINHSEARSQFALEGISIQLEGISPRSK